MRMPRHLRKSVFGKAVLATAALGGFLLFAGASSAQANDHCGRGMDRAQSKLHEAIEEHGFYSRQANHWRHELREEQQGCWREQRRWREHEWREHHRDSDRDYDHRDWDRR